MSPTGWFFLVLGFVNVGFCFLNVFFVGLGLNISRKSHLWCNIWSNDHQPYD